MANMAKLDVDEASAPRKGKKPLILGLVAMLALGGGGFFLTNSGTIRLPLPGAEESGHAEKRAEAHASPASAEAHGAFVDIGQMVVTLGPLARARHLRLAASLEVAPGTEAEVTVLMPRIKDVINSYLQALEESDVERPAAMARMRSHLLRRIRVVVGEDAVRDLLITEFVLQ